LLIGITDMRKMREPRAANALHINASAAMRLSIANVDVQRDFLSLVKHASRH